MIADGIGLALPCLPAYSSLARTQQSKPSQFWPADKKYTAPYPFEKCLNKQIYCLSSAKPIPS